MPLVSLEAIREAARRISAIARRTPVIDVSDLLGRPLLLKCEPQQPGGAFRLRGATNMVMRLSDDQRRRGVITYSSGNHGQAVALAASRLGAPAVIVMPRPRPRSKSRVCDRSAGKCCSRERHRPIDASARKPRRRHGD
jgi:threonine dehydratase